VLETLQIAYCPAIDDNPRPDAHEGFASHVAFTDPVYPVSQDPMITVPIGSNDPPLEGHAKEGCATDISPHNWGKLEIWVENP